MKEEKRVLILGGGFGGIYAYRAIRRARRQSGMKITVHIVSSQNYFLFSPMLHEVATGGLNRANIVEPIRQLIDKRDAFCRATVEAVDFNQKVVHTGMGDLSYDALVLALGATNNFFDVPGAAEFTLTLKTLEDAGRIRNRALQCLEAAVHSDDKAEQQRLLTWAIVGGGPTGVELAAELVDYARSYAGVMPSLPIDFLDVRLYQATDHLIPMFSPRLQQSAEELLRRKGIKVFLSCKVSCIKEESLTTSEGDVPVGFTVWAAGVQGAPLSVTPHEAAASNRRFPVTQALQHQQYPEVFVVGDLAKIDGVPQTAQAAVAEAGVAGKNVVALLTGKKLTSFVFHKKGDLVSVGQWQAIGEVMGINMKGAFTWWIWRTVYLFKLVGFPNRIRVAIDWTINLFYPRDLTEL